MFHVCEIRGLFVGVPSIVSCHIRAVSFVPLLCFPAPGWLAGSMLLYHVFYVGGFLGSHSDQAGLSSVFTH